MSNEAEREWEVWSEGYRINGNSAGAKLHGVAKGRTFAEAAQSLLSGSEYFDAARLTYWGCHLYDNEGDARRHFG